MQALHERNGEYWEVPYLPIDPSDIGRQYEPIVRIQQSVRQGRRSVCNGYLLWLQASEGNAQGVCRCYSEDFREAGRSFSGADHGRIQKLLPGTEGADSFPEVPDYRYRGGGWRICNIRIKVVYTDHGMEKTFEGVGNGPIDAVQRGLEKELGINIKVLDYNEHALRSGSTHRQHPIFI